MNNQRKEGLYLYDHSKLRGRIIEKYGSISEFSAALGVSLTTISEKLNNKTGLSRADIDRWNELLGISTDEIGAFYFAKTV